MNIEKALLFPQASHALSTVVHSSRLSPTVPFTATVNSASHMGRDYIVLPDDRLHDGREDVNLVLFPRLLVYLGTENTALCAAYYSCDHSFGVTDLQ